MVIDTSALIAILQDEPERPAFTALIAAADSRLLSMATFLEAAIVIEARHGAEGARELDLLVDRAGFEFVAVDREQIKLARDAWRRFGKGQHSAALNFGDCFAYALARALNQPLLFKGTDFSQTDVTPCQPAR